MAAADSGDLRLRAWREERGLFIPAAISGVITLILVVMAAVGGGRDSLGASAWNGAAVMAAITVLLVGGAWLCVASMARAERRAIERVAAAPLVTWPQVRGDPEEVPTATVSTEGIYDEELGVVEIESVTEVRVIPAAEVEARRAELRAAVSRMELSARMDPADQRLATAGWSLLELTLDSRVGRTLLRRLANVLLVDHGPMGWETVSVVHVRVPPGQEQAAAGAASAIATRWITSPPV
jgi:hypothetical protein